MLGATDVDDLGFSLEAGQGNSQALDEVQNHINLMAGNNKQVILEDMVEARFGRRPYGWPEWEVVLLVARLVKKGDISLVMDGATLSTDKVYEAVSTPGEWTRITVIKRKTVGDREIQRARNLAKDVFGQIAPDGEDALDAFLREKLGAWRTNLTQYKTLADTGDYPGKAEIADALGVIAKLLAEKESLARSASFWRARRTCATCPTTSMSWTTSTIPSARPGRGCARPTHGSSSTAPGWTRTEPPGRSSASKTSSPPPHPRPDQGCRVADPDRGGRQHRPGHEAPGPCPPADRRPHREGRGGARCRVGIQRSAQPVSLSPAEPEAPGRDPGQHRAHQSGAAECSRGGRRGDRQDRGPGAAGLRQDAAHRPSGAAGSQGVTRNPGRRRRLSGAPPPRVGGRHRRR